VTGHVYRAVRGVTRAVGGGLDALLGQLAPLVADVPDTSSREALVAALNGVLGDYLARTANPLAIAMRMRRDGVPLGLERDALAARVSRPSSTLVLAVHGLCMNDLQWSRAGHDHAEALARDLGGTAVYLRYNSGLHVSTNGRELAALLEALVDAWPVPVARIVVLGHSMGGHVARSAAHYVGLAGHRWRTVLESLVFLGTPHRGSPLELAAATASTSCSTRCPSPRRSAGSGA
jgi:pimeloyl-ACP methyl ester carboxylesterase